LIDRCLGAIRSVCTDETRAYGLHEPTFEGNDRAYAKECLDTGWVSSAGKFVDRFERRLAEYTGSRRAVAVVNGTAALHVGLQLAGVGPGDEVIVPALTFVATANAVTYCGGIPHFADVEERTLGIDPTKLRDHLRRVAHVESGRCRNRLSGRRIRAAVPMHAFGHPVDLDPLAELCDEYGISLVEDAAEALGSRYKGCHVGNHGILSVLSFNGNKIITTGGGGAILTLDDALADRIRHLTTTAKRPHRWEFFHDEVGYNYRMPNINAAIGCAQLEQLDGFLARKRAIAERYRDAFEGIPGVRWFREPDFASSNYWLNVILLDDSSAHLREALLAATNDAGIMARPAWIPLHELPMYRSCPKMDLSVTSDLERRLINLPSSSNL
jgi:perosamine synthetase